MNLQYFLYLAIIELLIGIINTVNLYQQKYLCFAIKAKSFTDFTKVLLIKMIGRSKSTAHICQTFARTT